MLARPSDTCPYGLYRRIAQGRSSPGPSVHQTGNAWYSYLGQARKQGRRKPPPPGEKASSPTPHSSWRSGDWPVTSPGTSRPSAMDRIVPCSSRSVASTGTNFSRRARQIPHELPVPTYIRGCGRRESSLGRSGEERRDDKLRLVLVQAGPAPLTSNNTSSTYQKHQDSYLSTSTYRNSLLATC
jgi:hypothetical protein